MGHLKIKLIAILGCLLVSMPLAAKREALMIGGGCETEWKSDRTCDQIKDAPSCEPVSANSGGGLPLPVSEKIPPNQIGRENLFTKNFELAKKTLTPENGWDKVQYLYAGDDWVKRPKDTPGVKKLTRDNLFKSLDEVKKRLKGPGHQFMLTISTHGSEPPHGVCMGDGTIVPISDIKEKLVELKKAGINVGVVDGSCYSGGTAEAFRDIGICAIGGTGSNVVGMMDTANGDIVSNLFGLTSTPNNSQTPPRGFFHPTGILNHNGDDKITMSEYLRFLRIKAPDFSPVIPRTSECSLDRGMSPGRNVKNSDLTLGDQLELCSRFLNATGTFSFERGQNMDNGQISYTDGSNEEICQVGTIADAFTKFLTPLNTTQKAAIKLQHLNMGIEYAESDQELIKNVKINIAKIVSKKNELKELDRAMGNHCVDNPWAEEEKEKVTCSIPKPLLDKINKAYAEVGELKDKIRRNIRLLIDYSCEMERATAHNLNHTACESFPIFPANKVPTEGAR